VKFGINVPNFGPGTDPASLAEWVRFAGSAGFDLAMMSDHIAVTPDVAELYPPPFYDPFTILAWLAGITERIELGTTVTVLPYRNPLLTARMAATIDRISGGRFILGVGVGWSKQEYAAIGVPFERRGAITDEYLAAIGELWTTEVASYNGEFVSFRDIYTAPSPSRQPHPRSGSAASAPRRCAALLRSPTRGTPTTPNSAGSAPKGCRHYGRRRPPRDAPCPRCPRGCACDFRRPRCTRTTAESAKEIWPRY
jgi:alkanesulfonate monooxygenase SsuD/methylene tetrahydromethanopterin reductase-like flavin-dependent oxidoreductase (luciferase family)